MKNRLLLLLSLVVLAFGCSNDSIINHFSDPSLSDEVRAALVSPLFEYDGSDIIDKFKPTDRGNAVTRKFKVRNSTTINFIPGSEDCGGLFKVVIEGEGNASHMGLFTIYIDYCSDGENPTGPILGVQTAANGDTLLTALVGAGFDPELGQYLDWIYYDGTGRFEGAYGEIRLYGVIDYVNGVGELAGEGTITY